MKSIKLSTLLLLAFFLLCSYLTTAAAVDRTVPLEKARESHAGNVRLLQAHLGSSFSFLKRLSFLQPILELSLFVVFGMLFFNAIEFYSKTPRAIVVSFITYIGLFIFGLLQRKSDRVIVSDHFLPYKSFAMRSEVRDEPLIERSSSLPSGKVKERGPIASFIKSRYQALDDHNIIEMLENIFIAHIATYCLLENGILAAIFIPSYVLLRFTNKSQMTDWKHFHYTTFTATMLMLACLVYYFVCNFGLAIRLGLTALGGLISSELYQLSVFKA